MRMKKLIVAVVLIAMFSGIIVGPMASATTTYPLTIYAYGLPSGADVYMYYTYFLNSTSFGNGLVQLIEPSGASIYTAVLNVYNNTLVTLYGKLWTVSGNNDVPYTAYLPNVIDTNITMNYAYSSSFYYTQNLTPTMESVAINVPSAYNTTQYTVTLANTANYTSYTYTEVGNFTTSLPSGLYYVTAITSDYSANYTTYETISTTTTILLSFHAITQPTWQTVLNVWFNSNFGFSFTNFMIVVVILVGIVIMLFMLWLKSSLLLAFIPLVAISVLTTMFSVTPIWVPIVLIFMLVMILLWVKPERTEEIDYTRGG